MVRGAWLSEKRYPMHDAFDVRPANGPMPEALILVPLMPAVTTMMVAAALAGTIALSGALGLVGLFGRTMEEAERRLPWLAV